MAHPAFQVWTLHQSTSQATILFYVPRRTRSADLDIRISRDHITAGVRDQPAVINASLWAPVHSESSSWQIERTSRRQRKSSRRQPSYPRSPPFVPADAASGAVTSIGATSPRLSSGPPSTAYSVIGDSAPGSHGPRSASDLDSGSESEADGHGSGQDGYISQAEEGPPARRRLPRFDPNATRSFSSRSRIVPVAQADGENEVDGQHGQEAGLASSIASLPARLRPQAAQATTTATGLPAPAPAQQVSHSTSATRLASRSTSTTSFSSLGSASFEMDLDLPTSGDRGWSATASSTSSMGSIYRQAQIAVNSGLPRARSNEVEELSQSQDGFLSIDRAGSQQSSTGPARTTSMPHHAALESFAADPTPMAERRIEDLLQDASAGVESRPCIRQTNSHDSGEMRSGSGSGSESRSGSGSGPSSNVSASIILPPTTNVSGPASTSAASTSSGMSATSLAGARLVTIYLDKVTPEIWPVLISGPAPLPVQDLDEPAPSGGSPSLPSLSEQHARNSLRAALKEALDESRSKPSGRAVEDGEGARQARIVVGHRRDSEAGQSSITAANDDSDTVLGPRFPQGFSATDSECDGNQGREGGTSGAPDEQVRTTSERQRRAEERQLCAKYNLDATSLVILGLQSRAQLGDRVGGVDEAFHYFTRAWRAALSPVATCRLVEDYLPLRTPRTDSFDHASEAETDALRMAGAESGTAPNALSAAEDSATVGLVAGVDMSRLQHSGDTLRSPKSTNGANSPVTTQAGPSDEASGNAKELPSQTAEARRDALIAILGGSNALGRLYLSYARVHLEVAFEKWTSPLAFPGEAGQLHGPYATSNTAAMGGAASPAAGFSGGAGSAALGGGSSPGVPFHGSGPHPSSGHVTAGLGLNPGGLSTWDALTTDPARLRGVQGPAGVASSTSARSPSSVQSGRSGSLSPNPHGLPSNAGEQTSLLLFASHERERALRRRPGPLAYMQAAVRLDPTLATSLHGASSGGSGSGAESSPARPFPLLPGESGAQAWRMPMAIEEDEWAEAHELEAERRAAIHSEARYRASLTGAPMPASPSSRRWARGGGRGGKGGHRAGSASVSVSVSGSGSGTATPTTSSVPSSEAGYPLGPAASSVSRRLSNQHAYEGLPPTASASASAAAAASSRRSGGHHKSSRRHGHGRSSMRRRGGTGGPPSTLPLISEEGMINIVSSAAVLSVVVAGSVAVMGWWRRVGGAAGPGGPGGM